MLNLRFSNDAVGLVIAVVFSGTSAAETGITNKEILIGQSLSLTGPLDDLGVGPASACMPILPASTTRVASTEGSSSQLSWAVPSIVGCRHAGNPPTLAQADATY